MPAVVTGLLEAERRHAADEPVCGWSGRTRAASGSDDRGGSGRRRGRSRAGGRSSVPADRSATRAGARRAVTRASSSHRAPTRRSPQRGPARDRCLRVRTATPTRPRRRHIGDVGAHQVEVGDERLGHRLRRRRRRQLAGQLDDVGVEAHQTVDGAVVQIDILRIRRSSGCRGYLLPQVTRPKVLAEPTCDVRLGARVGRVGEHLRCPPVLHEHTGAAIARRRHLGGEERRHGR